MKKYVALESKFGGALRETSMVDSDYKGKNIHWLEFAGGQCPICGGCNWCMVNVTGTKVICMRPSERKTDLDGKKLEKVDGYLYCLGEKYKAKFDVNSVKQVKAYRRAKDSVIDLFYRSVLLGYPLLDKNKQNLYARGLTDDMINIHGGRGFGSYYNNEKNIQTTDNQPEPHFNQLYVKDDKLKNIWLTFLDKLAKNTKSGYYNANLWHGVPGFAFFRSYYEQAAKSLNDLTLATSPIFAGSVDGLLVPYYNEYNELVGFQVRADHVSTYAKVIMKPQSHDYIKVQYDSNTKKYLLYKQDKYGSQDVIASGIAQSNVININHLGKKYQIKIEHGGKYFWVSSSKREGGATGKMPIQVAYNPNIAKLDPTKIDKNGKLSEKGKIKEYITKPKSVWLTEGGLKAYIVSMYLSKHFSKEELDKYGNDVLGVAGVSSYRNFLPMLKKLNVTTVTTAYDMDFRQNEQVKERYKSLIKLLKENGYKIRIAHWDGSQSKGLDDALVNNLEIDFQEIN